METDALAFRIEKLIDALRRSLVLSLSVGAYCVVVDALNENARQWYERFGFRPTVDIPMRLFMRMKKIEAL